jgi:hypothetical protein
MREKELTQKCLGLMETAEVVYFNTVDDEGFLQTRGYLITSQHLKLI